jgi:hypothetical protein
MFFILVGELWTFGFPEVFPSAVELGGGICATPYSF